MRNTTKTIFAAALMGIIGFGAISSSAIAATKHGTNSAQTSSVVTPKKAVTASVKSTVHKYHGKQYHKKTNLKSQPSTPVKAGLRAVPLKSSNVKK
ncbi:hypothetical protein [Calothrix sp. NIES-3974]|uniref:hypothetical protein n=1 Tax=Calothrix sp. NIES-3974 TaxID=2005462 RepID=UPI000B5E1B0D|nr:hypothetical protein [Calothrix sp. NIES-3974]BAZ04710.1 hypothetical protein NIES3974_13530 [Calothrix sp. NIES-3974]